MVSFVLYNYVDFYIVAMLNKNRRITSVVSTNEDRVLKTNEILTEECLYDCWCYFPSAYTENKAIAHRYAVMAVRVGWIETSVLFFSVCGPKN